MDKLKYIPIKVDLDVEVTGWFSANPLDLGEYSFIKLGEEN